MNRIDRLMGIVLMLQSRRITKAEDIAVHFEISLRTVYRDVSALSELGVPIVAEAGVGYSLLKGYHLPPIMFTEDEAAALGMAALSLTQVSDPSLETSIGAALLKVRSALPEKQRRRLERVESSVKIGWRNEAAAKRPETAQVIDLQAMLCQNVALRILYQKRGCEQPESRIVDPVGLLFYLNHWHLIAWCRLRRDYRDFRVDRIQGVEATEERVVAREGFSLDEYLDSQRGLETPILVKVCFAEQVFERAKRDWSWGIVKEESTSEGVVLTLVTDSLQWLVGWLLSFRDSARVIEPNELRSLLAEEAARLSTHHGRP